MGMKKKFKKKIKIKKFLKLKRKNPGGQRDKRTEKPMDTDKRYGDVIYASSLNPIW